MTSDPTAATVLCVVVLLLGTMHIAVRIHEHLKTRRRIKKMVEAFERSRKDRAE